MTTTERGPYVSLSNDDVRRLREGYARGRGSQAELAKAFGCSQTAASALIRGQVRRGAGGPLLGVDYEHPGTWPGKEGGDA